MKLKLIIMSLCIMTLSACSNGAAQLTDTTQITSSTNQQNQELRELSNSIQQEKLEEMGETEQNQEEAMKINASFAFYSVKWNDRLYKLTDEKLSEADVETEQAIGEVKHHSTAEQENVPNDYSNYLIIGTQLWSIKGMDTEEAIAVKNEDGSYSKLVIAS